MAPEYFLLFMSNFFVYLMGFYGLFCKLIFILFIFIAQSYLLCYQCVSTHPGCGSPFKWLWYKTVSCPEEDDICVKVIEKKGGNCFSGLNSSYLTTDFPKHFLVILRKYRTIISIVRHNFVLMTL